MQLRLALAMLLSSAGVLAAGNAQAHFGIGSGPAFANKTQKVVFTAGHGCDGLDTFAVRIAIPAGVTSVRPLNSDFGLTAVEKNAEDAVVAVSWEKPVEDVLDSDISYYELAVRMKVPDKPFTIMYFPVTQTCRAQDGTLTVVEWNALPGQMGEPAAALTVLPARLPGWNKYSNNEHIDDPSLFFQDATIVWKGSAAYSFNPAIVDLIKATEGVTELTDGIHPDDEIWVLY